MASAFKRLTPLFNRILIKKFEAQTKTASGILLANESEKTTIGVVVEVGPGQLDNNGKLIPISVKTGDTVLLPDYGGNKIKLFDDKEYFLYRDSDILGILHK